MQTVFQKIIAFFMSIVAFFAGLFGLNKKPADPQPEPTGVTEPAAEQPSLEEQLQTVKLIAHRGATFAAPENTLPAFEYAAHDRCAGVELDVRRTSDGVIVLSHDARLTGTLNGVQTSLSISENTYDSLCEISLGQDAAGGEIRIPTLSQALALLDSLGLEAEIHCKQQNVDFLRQVARAVTQSGMSGKCAYNTDTDFVNTIPPVLEEDPNARFHIPYAEALADPSIRTLVPAPTAIIATVDVSAVSGETAARIRSEGFSLYVAHVKANELKTILAAAPDYIEFVSGVRVSELLAAG